MNVAFHQLAGIAIAHEAAAHLGPPGAPARGRRVFVWTMAFGLAVLSHGILDALPHYYPLQSWEDAAASIALTGGWLLMAPRWMRLPLFLVCVGATLPDVIDHLPKDLNRHLGLELPIAGKVFPWHWKSGSGSYRGRTGPLWIESLTYHAIVVAFAGAVIARTRHLLRSRI